MLLTLNFKIYYAVDCLGKGPAIDHTFPNFLFLVPLLLTFFSLILSIFSVLYSFIQCVGEIL